MPTKSSNAVKVNDFITKIILDSITGSPLFKESDAFNLEFILYRYLMGNLWVFNDLIDNLKNFSTYLLTISRIVNLVDKLILYLNSFFYMVFSSLSVLI